MFELANIRNYYTGSISIKLYRFLGAQRVYLTSIFAVPNADIAWLMYEFRFGSRKLNHLFLEGCHWFQKYIKKIDSRRSTRSIAPYGIFFKINIK